MKKYSLLLCDYFPDTTKIRIFELCKDGKSIFKAFFEETEKDSNLFNSLAGALRIVEDTANLSRRPQKKFREISGHNLKCKVYEAKSKSVRIYLFHEEKTGRIIVTGGTKGKQKKDIKNVISIIKDYQDENNQ